MRIGLLGFVLILAACAIAGGLTDMFVTWALGGWLGEVSTSPFNMHC